MDRSCERNATPLETSWGKFPKNCRPMCGVDSVEDWRSVDDSGQGGKVVSFIEDLKNNFDRKRLHSIGSGIVKYHCGQLAELQKDKVDEGYNETLQTEIVGGRNCRGRGRGEGRCRLQRNTIKGQRDVCSLRISSYIDVFSG